MSSWLVTRPADDAAAVAEALAARGHAAVVAPVMTVVPIHGAALPLGGVAAVLFTSANGVRAFAGLSGRRDIRALAVGEATAAVARAAGFEHVESAGGDAADLARLAIERLDPKAGPLVHAGGQMLAGDLAGRLEAAGFTVRRAVLYRTVPAAQLPAAAAEALAARGLAGALFFSPRTAEVFARLVAAAGLSDRLGRLIALCLSRAAADRLESASGAGAWGEIRVAGRPDLSSLLALLDAPAGMVVDSPAPTGLGRLGQEMESSPERPADRPPEEDAANGSAAARIIARFGGIRPMAHKLVIPVTTVQGWKKRGVIPEPRHADILAAAAAQAVMLDPAELALAGREPAPGASPAPAPAPALPEPPPDALDPRPAEPAPDLDPVPLSALQRPPPEPPSPARGGTGLAALALLIAILGAAAAATGPWWQPRLLGVPAAEDLDRRLAALEAAAAVARPAAEAGDPAARAAVADLQAQLAALAARPAPPAADGGEAAARLDALARRVDEMAASLAAAPPAPGTDGGAADGAAADARAEESARQLASLAGDIDALGGRLDALAPLGDRISALEGATAALESLRQSADALSARLERLAQRQEVQDDAIERLTGLTAKIGEADARTQALVLAAVQLRAAIAEGEAFAVPLATARTLVEDDPELAAAIAALEPRAAEGIPDRTVLRARFAETARAVLAAAAVPEDAGWLDRTLGALDQVVTVRQAPGEVEGDDPEAILARAEGRLIDGRLADAAATMRELEGPALDAARPWIEAAEARLAAEDAMDRLTAVAISRLEGGPAEAAAGDGAPAGEPAPQ